MGTTLTGTTPQDTYDSLIKVTDNGPLSGTAKYLSDGLGNDSVLALSTSSIGIATTSLPTSFALGSSTTGFSFTSASSSLNSGKIAVLKQVEIGSGNGDLTIETYAGGAGGGERMRITSAGNVGIGTSSPTQKLSVVNGSIFTSRTDSSENIIISDGTTNSSIQQVTHLYLNSGGNSATFGDIIFRTKNSYTEMARFTQNGLCFNGDTAAANALDDYEEGTFTPTMLGATFTLTTASGYYTKIGRQVSIWIECEGTYSSPTGAFRVTSLPFTQAGGRAEGIFSAVAGISFGNYCSAETIGTTMYLESHASGTGTNRTDMDSTFFNAAGFRFMVSQTYFV